MMSEKKSSDKRWLVKELHATARKNFPRRRVIVCGCDDLWQTDLIHIRSYILFNIGYYYILIIVDVLSKHAWAVPLKTKSGNDVAITIVKIIQDDGRCPKNLQTDRGNEFYNANFTCRILHAETLEETWYQSSFDVFRNESSCRLSNDSTVR